MPSDDLRFHETIESFRDPIVKAGCVVVGYSGGADSSCLLRLMNDWCRENGIKLAAAHINHCIRGDEADCDEDFCRRTCESLGIEFFAKRVNVPEIAEQKKTGIEETARQVRYSFFDEVSEKLTDSQSSAVIATAHNADDNLETVIFNLLRGSGLRGMCGIDPFRDGRYIRPLINASGESIRSWCAENAVDYVTDRTNSDTDYTRNRIRHIIVPEMRKIVPNPAASVMRMSENLRSDRDYLEAEAAEITADGNLSRKAVASLHPALSSRVLRILFDSAKTDTASLEEKHIRAALEMLKSDAPHAFLSLPGSMRMTVDRDTVTFEPDPGRQRAKQDDSRGEIRFTYPTDGDFYSSDGYRVEFSRNHHDFHTENHIIDENIYKLSILTILRFDKITGVLRIRNRLDGDSYVFGGMTRKVKRLFGDKKLTAREKEHLPIFEDDLGIVWIPGFPLRDGLRFEGEGQPLTITYKISDDITSGIIGG